MNKRRQMFSDISWSMVHGSSRRAFTLVELLVSIALFGMIAAAVLFTYSKVSGQLSVSSLAYEIALSFRQAQSYGVSVHEFQEGSERTFDVGYGLHFDSGNAKTYAFFADEGGEQGDRTFNGAYGSTYTESGCIHRLECVNVFRLEKGNRLYKFCGVLPLGDMGAHAPDENKNEECNVDSLPPQNLTITFLDVVFLRPNPDAIITTSQFGRAYRAARIYIVSPIGQRRIVEVANTGQIVVR